MTDSHDDKIRPRTKGPTMRDVAKLAGVSQTAVSLVLNDRRDIAIAESTRQRVRQAIEQLGYRPNVVAQSLRSGRSGLLGFVTDEIATTPFAGDIVRGAQDEAWQQGRILTLVNTGNRAGLQSDAVAALVQHQVDGIMLATMYHREVVLPAGLAHVPFVLVNCFCADPTQRAVVPDEEQGSLTAVRHLIAHGHRRIGFVTDAADVPAAIGRLAGFRRGLREAGLPERNGPVVRVASDQDGGYDGAVRLLARGNRPTALFCFNDRMAMGAIAALTEAGLRVPRDMSVVGFDNQILIAAHLRPTLTTVQLPHYEMGRWGVRTLLGQAPDQALTRLPCPLVERASVATLA